MLRYPVRFTRAEGRVRITFLDFPGVHAFADDEVAALAHAAAALTALLKGMIEDREELPVPVVKRGRFITLPVLTEAKIALYREMRSEGIGKAELARRLHCHLPQIDRLLDLEHASRLEQIEQAFLVLGKRLTFSLEDAGLSTPDR
jgi:antitoxin HicB